MAGDEPRPGRTFSIAEIERLPEVSLEYRRLPSRVSHVPTRVLHVDADQAIWINRLSPSKPLMVNGRQVMGAGYWGVWFLWNGRPYDLGKVFDPDLRHTGYYVDVLEPVAWQPSSPHRLDPLTDLFLDIWITPEGEWQVLDEAEFDEAAEHGWMTADQVAHASNTLADLIGRLHSGDFLPQDVAFFSLAP